MKATSANPGKIRASAPARIAPLRRSLRGLPSANGAAAEDQPVGGGQAEAIADVACRRPIAPSRHDRVGRSPSGSVATMKPPIGTIRRRSQRNGSTSMRLSPAGRHPQRSYRAA
jgi:hypothetical protein